MVKMYQIQKIGPVAWYPDYENYGCNKDGDKVEIRTAIQCSSEMIFGGKSCVHIMSNDEMLKLRSDEFIWEYWNGYAPPWLVLVHKNGNSNDDRLDNLTLLTLEHVLENNITYLRGNCPPFFCGFKYRKWPYPKHSWSFVLCILISLFYRDCLIEFSCLIHIYLLIVSAAAGWLFFWI